MSYWLPFMEEPKDVLLLARSWLECDLKMTPTDTIGRNSFKTWPKHHNIID